MDPFAKQEQDLVTSSSQTDAQSDGRINLAAGCVIAERYQIVSFIGQGAMGAVYEVEQIYLKKRFALKTLSPINMSDTAAMRFQKEALAASKLEHANLVRAYDFGLIDGVQPYFIMDLLHGTTLAEHLKRVGHLSVEEALKLFVPLCEAMGYAHEQGVIHRDIKPSNIILTRSTGDESSPLVPKLVDFGIAKLAQSDEYHPQTLTRTGDAIGTPLYMSPEQCLGNRVDNRSDIYSLGCVLFEALTGAPPFTAASALGTMMQHQSSQAATLKEASMGLDFPPFLENVVAKMLAKDPDNRYRDCFELAKALRTHSETTQAIDADAAPGHKAKGQSLAINKQVAAIAAAMVVVTVIAAIVMITTLGKHEQPVSVPAALPESPANDVSLLDADDLKKNDAANATPIKKDGGGNWIYDFGTTELGECAFNKDDKDSPDWQRAIHSIPVPKGDLFYFKVKSSTVARNPSILSRFNDGDLYDLELQPAQGDFMLSGEHDGDLDDAVGYAHHLKSLAELRLSSNPVTMRALTILDINAFKQLKRLYLRNTSIDAGELASLKIFPQLTELEVSQLRHLPALLRRMGKAKEMRLLYIESGNLTNADVALIEMPKLKTLDLSYNTDISNAALKSIRKLPKLEDLYLFDCSITPAAIDDLAKLPHMYAIHLAVNRWDISQVKLLRNRLQPKTKLELYVTSGIWKDADIDALKALPNTRVQVKKPD